MPTKIGDAVAVQVDRLAVEIGEAPYVDLLVPPKGVAGGERDHVRTRRTRPGRKSLRADDDPVIAEPQDRGGGIARAGLQDLEPVGGRPALLAAEIAVEVGARLVLQHLVGVAGGVGLRRLTGRLVPIDPGKTLAVEDIAIADPGRRGAALHVGGVA